MNETTAATQENQVVEFSFEGDETKYRLKFDFNAIADAESVCGCNLFQVLLSVGTPLAHEITAQQMRGVLFALLRPLHPVVLLKEAGELFSKDTSIVTAAIARVFGMKEADAPDVKAAVDIPEANAE